MRSLFVVLVVLLAGSSLKHASALAPDSDAASAFVESASAAPGTNSAISFHRDGRWLLTEDKSMHLQIHGYAQADDRMFSSNLHAEELDTFFFRRIPPMSEGMLFNAVDFRFMSDFGKCASQIQEAYLDRRT